MRYNSLWMDIIKFYYVICYKKWLYEIFVFLKIVIIKVRKELEKKIFYLMKFIWYKYVGMD